MRNLNKPNRYNVASIQAQQTMGGDVMQADENGQYVEFRDYAWLLTEKQRLNAEVERMSKAGDDMAKNLTHIGWNICVDAWNAAKEGKQS